MTNSSVLLPDPNVDIKKTVENVVNAVIGEDHGGVTVNKKGTVTIPWPTRPETSTNQSDVIIRSDDRFLNLVVDSDSIVSKIYMLNFVLFSVSILTKILQFYPS
jgi:hypothetical protein